jgi:hypothetical protein
VKSKSPSSTHKKVVVVLLDGKAVKGYVNTATLGRAETIDLLTPEGEHKSIALHEVKSVYFVRELLDTGVQLTPPDLHGNSLRLFIPRTALEEMKVLGVVGAARRTGRDAGAARAIAAAQPKLFSE